MTRTRTRRQTNWIKYVAEVHAFIQSGTAEETGVGFNKTNILIVQPSERSCTEASRLTPTRPETASSQLPFPPLEQWATQPLPGRTVRRCRTAGGRSWPASWPTLASLSTHHMLARKGVSKHTWPTGPNPWMRRQGVLAGPARPLLGRVLQRGRSKLLLACPRDSCSLCQHSSALPSKKDAVMTRMSLACPADSHDLHHNLRGFDYYLL